MRVLVRVYTVDYNYYFPVSARCARCARCPARPDEGGGALGVWHDGALPTNTQQIAVPCGTGFKVPGTPCVRACIIDLRHFSCDLTGRVCVSRLDSVLIALIQIGGDRLAGRQAGRHLAHICIRAVELNGVQTHTHTQV